MRRTWLLILGGLLFAAAEIDEIRKEPDHVRRHERALAYAETSLQQAREHSASDVAKVPEALSRMAEASELSLQALRDTGRRPGKLSRQYKRGEMKTRDFLRRLDALIAALNFEDREKAQSYRVRLNATHEEYLLGVMSK